jgi:hypothetical protein
MAELIRKQQGMAKSREYLAANPDENTPRKKARLETPSPDDDDVENTPAPNTNVSPLFKIPANHLILIRKDKANGPHWQTVLDQVADTSIKRVAPVLHTVADWSQFVAESFACAICSSLPGESEPAITLACGGGHTFCVGCIIQLVVRAQADTEQPKPVKAGTGDDSGDDSVDGSEKDGEAVVPEPEATTTSAKYEASTCCPVCRGRCADLVRVCQIARATRGRKSDIRGWIDRTLKRVLAENVVRVNQEFHGVLDALNLRRSK